MHSTFYPNWFRHKEECSYLTNYIEGTFLVSCHSVLLMSPLVSMAQVTKTKRPRREGKVQIEISVFLLKLNLKLFLQEIGTRSLTLSLTKYLEVQNWCLMSSRSSYYSVRIILFSTLKGS